MTTALSDRDIAAAFLAACRAELQALKPGNVHIHAGGHGMDIDHFERAATAAAPYIANPKLSVGQRILKATDASYAATKTNVNLGIVLLCAPLAKAASEIDAGMGLRRRLAVILAMLDSDDADAAFAAIRLANPAGLGNVAQGDVRNSQAGLTLIEAMFLAQDRDRIARAYVTAYEDIFDFALPILIEARHNGVEDHLAITTLHMSLLAAFPDSHIARKHGPSAATAVQTEAHNMRALWFPGISSNSMKTLMDFDAHLKSKGLNPGTTADFVVATLFADQISSRKQP